MLQYIYLYYFIHRVFTYLFVINVFIISRKLLFDFMIKPCEYIFYYYYTHKILFTSNLPLMHYIYYRKHGQCMVVK